MSPAIGEVAWIFEPRQIGERVARDRVTQPDGGVRIHRVNAEVFGHLLHGPQRQIERGAQAAILFHEPIDEVELKGVHEFVTEYVIGVSQRARQWHHDSPLESFGESAGRLSCESWSTCPWKGRNMKREESGSIIGTAIVILIALGLAFAGSQSGHKVGGFPIYALGIAVAFLIQWIVFIPAWINRTEKFYDLTGGTTYIIVTLLAVLLTPDVDARSLLLAGIVTVWAVRLASFLFLRIRTVGEDRRFREIKQSFGRFLLAWSLQGLWVAFSLAAALAAITSTLRVDLDLFAWIGTFIWLTGFLIEVTADRQKRAFNAKPANKGRFISTGLWSWSRHPNYFGEIVLWIGVAVIALPILQGWQWVTLISPIFIIILLTRISGIPMLERRADQKWGGEAEYESYKARTSVLIPLPPSKWS